MKTTNNVQKTENRKFENPFVKTLAVVLSFVLISLTVSANGYWKQLLVNNTFGKMAIQMVNQENEELLASASEISVVTSSEVKSNAVNFLFDTAKDNQLEVENWMTKDSYFSSKILADQVAVDAPLKVEDWMVNNPNFSASEFATENESSLKVENWMTSESIWGN
jgi:hypothetical protein